VVQLMPDGTLSSRSLPSSASWQRLGAMGAGAEGDLYVLDSGSRRLLEYPGASLRLVDPPRSVLDSQPLEHTAEVLALRDVYLRLDSGRVRRFDREGRELGYEVRPPDGQLAGVAALASDRAGGLYVADPANERVVQTTANGHFVRQICDPALAGVRQLQSSLDGRRLFALVASGVLAFDLPDEIPAPVPGVDTVLEPSPELVK
jgi:hypothetical protein